MITLHCTVLYVLHRNLCLYRYIIMYGLIEKRIVTITNYNSHLSFLLDITIDL